MIDLDRHPDQSLLTVEEIALWLGCDRATVYRRRESWRLEFQRVGRRMCCPAWQVKRHLGHRRFREPAGRR